MTTASLRHLMTAVEFLEWLFHGNLDPSQRADVIVELERGWGNADTSEEELVWQLLAYQKELNELPAVEREQRRESIAEAITAAFSAEPSDGGRVLRAVRDAFTPSTATGIEANPLAQLLGGVIGAAFGKTGGLVALGAAILMAKAEEEQKQRTQKSEPQKTQDKIYAGWDRERSRIDEIEKTNPLMAGQLRVEHQQQVLAQIMETHQAHRKIGAATRGWFRTPKPYDR